MNTIDTKHSYISTFILYDCKSGKFNADRSDGIIFDAALKDRTLWDFLIDEDIAQKSTASHIRNTIKEISSYDRPTIKFEEYSLKASDGYYATYKTAFICTVPKDEIVITFTCINDRSRKDHDELTGLLNKKAFSQMLDEQIQKIPENEIHNYIVAYLDVQRFKVINDVFGTKKGDQLLIYMAAVISEAVGKKGIVCRSDSDRFLLFTFCPTSKADDFIKKLLDDIASFDLSFEIVCNAGIYDIRDRSLSASSIIDRAVMAQNSIKGSYTTQYKFYTEELRKELISEQEISGIMRTALSDEQFLVYYQPQYNHSTGMLVGAEALVRWMHPERGLIPPSHFIPIFEKNGFISKLDMYVFEKSCKFIKKCINQNMHIVPVSINLTRYDIFSPDFIDQLETVRKKYDIPSKYIRVEITESAALGNSQFINDAVHKLHSFGYIVEMDDFGSGYSSLNILKDIDFDIIKLDMKFLQNEDDDGKKGGTILSSIVRMVNWLGLPVIAEGVETVKQADYLISIGCEYIQGYLYSKPLPQDQYEKLLSGSAVGATIPQMKLIDTLNSANFWSYDSLETLIFSNFVGGAAIFDYKDGKIELVRLNKKYLTELGMNMTEKDLLSRDPFDFMDEQGKEDYIKMLESAIETGDEQECETWRTISSECCGEERMCLRSTVKMIGKSKENHLFYAMIRNITSEKKLLKDVSDSEKKFRMASEHTQTYCWEYTIATKEMHPCLRCMRDLGIPNIVRNYPEPLIENGLFPQEIADSYRNMMKQIDSGIGIIEAVLPLTANKIPFTVRYTTEFDETNRPIKAYGSATPV